jgi:hypothetical protein
MIITDSFFGKQVPSNWFTCLNCFFSKYYGEVKEVDYTITDLASESKRKRHYFFEKIVKSFNKNNILEYGGGQCFISRDITNVSVTCIDLYYRPILEKFNIKQLILNKTLIDSNFFLNSNFDIVTLDNVLEHLVNPIQLIKEISLIPNNLFVICSVPNKFNLKNFLFFKPNNEFLHITEHINIFTNKSIDHLFLNNGFNKFKYFKIMPKNLFDFFVFISINFFSFFGIYRIYIKKSN